MGLWKFLKYFISVKRQPVIDDADILKYLGFEVVDEVGAGAFGTVKLAKSKKHGRNVAIKVMDRRWMTLQFCSEILNVEIDTILKLNHPHIVRVHELIEVRDEQVYIVMEAAECCLSDVLDEGGALSNNDARRWFSQIVSATEYMHAQNIAHRDIKCENILVTADNSIRVTDFGLCSFTKGLPELCSTFCGTQYYLAPEVYNKKKYDAKKSDVWSLGVVLYCMVTGELPNDSSNTKDHANPKLPFTFPDDVEVDESCRALILDMLQLEPRARPSMREVLMHPWLLQPDTDTSTHEDAQSDTSTPQNAETDPFTSEDEESDKSTPQNAETDPFTSEDEESDKSTPQNEETDPFTSEDEESDKSTPQNAETDPFTSEDEESDKSTPQNEETDPFTSEDEESDKSTPQNAETDPFTSEDEESDKSTPDGDLEQHSGDTSTPKDAAVVSAEVEPEAAGASVNCPAIEVDVRERRRGCFGHMPFFRAVKRAARACAKASLKVRRKIKRFFCCTSSDTSSVRL